MHVYSAQRWVIPLNIVLNILPQNLEDFGVDYQYHSYGSQRLFHRCSSGELVFSNCFVLFDQVLHVSGSRRWEYAWFEQNDLSSLAVHMEGQVAKTLWIYC